jgi:hypothetical protein
MWGFLTVVLVIISFFYLFVCVDGNSGSFLAKIKIFLFKTFPDILRSNGRRYCGDRFVDTIEGLV